VSRGPFILVQRSAANIMLLLPVIKEIAGIFIGQKSNFT
jgi:hypothetical protein